MVNTNGIDICTWKRKYFNNDKNETKLYFKFLLVEPLKDECDVCSSPGADG